VKNRKVLIITYYWPPSGGAGVQRWLKFVKYLPQFGWIPIVYTPEGGELPVSDESLSKDIPGEAIVIRTKIKEPYNLYKKFVGLNKEVKINPGFLNEKKKAGIAERIAIWLRGNLFIPDARCFWIRPSVRYLTRYLSEHKVDIIVSSGPPHSMHLIAEKISRKFNLPWLSDFRDPWTNIDYYKDLMLSLPADKLHHKLERRVISKASRVVVIGKTMKEEFESQFHRPIDLITNGYDEEDFNINVPVRADKFVIAHTGTLVPSRNPEMLWQAIKELKEEIHGLDTDLEIRLIGKTDISVRNLIIQNKLQEYVLYSEYMSHDEIIRENKAAFLLLLILNNTQNAKGILTGKLFEYIASGRPILAIGPEDGDAAEILNSTESGKCIDFQNKEKMKAEIKSYYDRFKAMNFDPVHSMNRENYSRRKLTGNLVNILNEMISC